LIFYSRVIKGQASVALRSGTGDRTSDAPGLEMLPDDLIRYRKLEWQAKAPTELVALTVKAGPEGASILIRDFYPLILAPRGSRNRDP
jgi:hypothetical protein